MPQFPAQGQPKLKSFLNFMEQKGIRIQKLHTSGHADQDSIEKIINKANAEIIIPVHTENPDWFKKIAAKVMTDINKIEI